MDTLTANKIFWGLLAMAAIGFLVYLLILLGQRELGKIVEELTQLNRNIESQKVDIDKLKANKSNDVDKAAKSQIEGLTSQLQSLNEILRSVAPQLQSQQKEI
jgi:cell division protein FtsL